MAARKPLVYVGGFVFELPAEDSVSGAVQPNITATPTVNTLQQGEIAVDSSTNSLVVKIGNLVWRFAATEASSYNGAMSFNDQRNSHWIGVLA